VYTCRLSGKKLLRLLDREVTVNGEQGSRKDSSVLNMQHSLWDRLYFKKKGWKQDEFVRQRGSTAADATGTFIDEGNYVIGNRLIVQQAVKIAEELYLLIVNIFQNLNTASTGKELGITGNQDN